MYFWLYGIAYWALIQQKLTPPVLLFGVFADWICIYDHDTNTLNYYTGCGIIFIFHCQTKNKSGWCFPSFQQQQTNLHIENVHMFFITLSVKTNYTEWPSKSLCINLCYINYISKQPDSIHVNRQLLRYTRHEKITYAT